MSHSPQDCQSSSEPMVSLPNDVGVPLNGGVCGANGASDAASGVLPLNVEGLLPMDATKMSPDELSRIATTQGPPLETMDQATFEQALGLPHAHEFLACLYPIMMKFNENERRILAYQDLCEHKDKKISELEKEIEEQRSQFEAGKKAWQDEKKLLEGQLSKSNESMDTW